MNRDEFAFFNDQLAAMLRHGIPLEGALRQLTADMRRGRLRDELQALEAALAQGRPLRDALQERKLPEVYRRLLIAGAEGGDLPGMLTLVADYYHQASNLTARLKGLMVYPLLALLAALVVSVLLARVLSAAAADAYSLDWTMAAGEGTASTSHPLWYLGLWLPPVLLGVAAVAALLAFVIPGIRNALRWRLPGFREASLAQLAGTMALLLKAGCRLPEALRLCANLEPATAASAELRSWDERLSQGEATLGQGTSGTTVFPPLFRWLITGDSEDWPSGFARAADVYRRRAQAKAEMLLYAALPVSVLFLGGLVLGQGGFAVSVIYRSMAGQLEAMGG